MRGIALGVMLVVAAGCYARHSGPFFSKVNERFPRTAAAFAQIRPGMEQGEVQVLLGPPDAVDAEITPWGWLLLTPDAWRYVYHYRGFGRVTFSGSVYNALGSVRRVDRDASEGSR